MYDHFYNDFDILSHATDSVLQTVWKNHYEGKRVLILGEILGSDKSQASLTVAVISSYYHYATFYDSDSYIHCLEVILPSYTNLI